MCIRGLSEKIRVFLNFPFEMVSLFLQNNTPAMLHCLDILAAYNCVEEKYLALLCTFNSTFN